jgi:hypothetical protein
METKLVKLQGFANELVGYTGDGTLMKCFTDSLCPSLVHYLLHMIDVVLAIGVGDKEIPRADYWFMLMVCNSQFEGPEPRFFSLMMQKIEEESYMCNDPKCIESCRDEYTGRLLTSLLTSGTELHGQYTGSSTCLALFILNNLFFVGSTEEQILDEVLSKNLSVLSENESKYFATCLVAVLSNVHLIIDHVSLIVDPHTKETLGFSFDYEKGKVLSTLSLLKMPPRILLTPRPPIVSVAKERDIYGRNMVLNKLRPLSPILEEGEEQKNNYKDERRARYRKYGSAYEPGTYAYQEQQKDITKAVATANELYSNDKATSHTEALKERNDYIKQKWYLNYNL